VTIGEQRANALLTLRRSALNAREAYLHLVAAMYLFADEGPVTDAVIDRVETQVSFAHEKTTKAKQGLYRVTKQLAEAR
jgi:hypothetical protein